MRSFFSSRRVVSTQNYNSTVSICNSYSCCASIYCRHLFIVPLDHSMFSLSLLGLLITVEAASFNFIVHGDWGWIGENQSLVADQMGRYADMLDARFVIALGLYFTLYWRGVL